MKVYFADLLFAIGGPRTGLPLNEQELGSVQWRRDAFRLNPRNLCADPTAAAGELLATIDRLLATIESRGQRIKDLAPYVQHNDKCRSLDYEAPCDCGLSSLLEDGHDPFPPA